MRETAVSALDDDASPSKRTRFLRIHHVVEVGQHHGIPVLGREADVLADETGVVQLASLVQRFEACGGCVCVCVCVRAYVPGCLTEMMDLSVTVTAQEKASRFAVPKKTARLWSFMSMATCLSTQAVCELFRVL